MFSGMSPNLNRRDVLKSSGTLFSGCMLASAASSSVVAQENSRIEVENTALTAAIEQDDFDSKTYLTSLSMENQTITRQPHEFQGYNLDSERLGHQATERNAHLKNDDWELIWIKREFAYEENNSVSITHQINLPPNQSSLLITVGYENKTSSPITIERPDSHIHEGMMLARTPPLSSPQGTYQYYVDGHSEQVFSEGELSHAY